MCMCVALYAYIRIIYRFANWQVNLWRQRSFMIVNEPFIRCICFDRRLHTHIYMHMNIRIFCFNNL